MPIIVRFTTFKKRDPFRSATGGAADRPYFRITFHPQQAAAGQKNSVNPPTAITKVLSGSAIRTVQLEKLLGFRMLFQKFNHLKAIFIGINAGRRIHPGYRYMDLLAVAQCSELFKFLLY